MNPLFSAELAAQRDAQLSPRTRRPRRGAHETTVWRTAPRRPTEH